MTKIEEILRKHDKYNDISDELRPCILNAMEEYAIKVELVYWKTLLKFDLNEASFPKLMEYVKSLEKRLIEVEND